MTKTQTAKFICKYCKKEFSEPALLFKHLNGPVVECLLKRIEGLELAVKKIFEILKQIA